jgi:hypothetical protein
MMRLGPPFENLFGLPSHQLSIIVGDHFVIVRATVFSPCPYQAVSPRHRCSTIHGPWDTDGLPLIKEDIKCQKIVIDQGDCQSSPVRDGPFGFSRNH